jgi:hypothetical protein
LNETKQDRPIEEHNGGLNSKPHETSITWKIPHHSSTKTTGQAQEVVFSSRGRGRGRGPPKIQNHDPRDPYFYCTYHERGHSTEACPETINNVAGIQQEKTMMSIASAMPNQFHQNFWQPQMMGPVNTKKWYRRGTDLWAEFGDEIPFI